MTLWYRRSLLIARRSHREMDDVRPAPVRLDANESITSRPAPERIRGGRMLLSVVKQRFKYPRP